jgi:hypothetical protein
LKDPSATVWASGLESELASASAWELGSVWASESESVLGWASA